jgi:hypothetical protein
VIIFINVVVVIAPGPRTLQFADPAAFAEVQRCAIDAVGRPERDELIVAGGEAICRDLELMVEDRACAHTISCISRWTHTPRSRAHTGSGRR